MPPFPGTSIRIGDRGESVRQIQRCLNNVSNRHPSIQRLTDDGVFGPRTLDSATTFQLIFGLVADGEPVKIEGNCESFDYTRFLKITVS